jgi:uncharacterized protein (TIGR00730 family)
MGESPGNRPVICIFGSYSPKRGDPLYEQAYAIGQALAEAGYVVANGGYDGTMEASARGAKDAGGHTIGVTCSVFSDYRGKPLKANRHIDREIPCDDLFTRINRMMRISAGYVFLRGGTGTLSELGLVWEHVAKGLINPRPIFIVGDFWAAVANGIVSDRPRHGQYIHRVDTPEEIVAIAARTIRPG